MFLKQETSYSMLLLQSCISLLVFRLFLNSTDFLLFQGPFIRSLFKCTIEQLPISQALYCQHDNEDQRPHSVI